MGNQQLLDGFLSPVVVVEDSPVYVVRHVCEFAKEPGKYGFVCYAVSYTSFCSKERASKFADCDRFQREKSLKEIC